MLNQHHSSKPSSTCMQNPPCGLRRVLFGGRVVAFCRDGFRGALPILVAGWVERGATHQETCPHSLLQEVRSNKNRRHGSIVSNAAATRQQRGTPTISSNAGHPQFRMDELSDSRVSGLYSSGLYSGLWDGILGVLGFSWAFLLGFSRAFSGALGALCSESWVSGAFSGLSVSGAF